MLVRIEPVHVDTPYFALTTTQARRKFKSNAGQNNHFLITLLVGLDSVAGGSAVLKPEFSTSWSPKNESISAARSREYALRTSLAWIADVVDDYRRTLTTMPGLLDERIKSRINSADGRAARLRELSNHLISPDPIELDIVRFGIHWRNRIVHASAKTTLDRQVAARLSESAELVRGAHRGLDVKAAMTSADAGASPRFKEVASIILAAQLLVQNIDTAAVQTADPATFAESLIADHLRRTARFGSTNGAPMLWPGNPAKSEQRIRQLLLQGGFAPASEPSRSIPQHYLDELYKLRARDGQVRFLSARNEEAANGTP